MSGDHWSSPDFPTNEIGTQNSVEGNYQIPRVELNKESSPKMSDNMESNNAIGNDGSWINPAYRHDNHDLGENYQIPRVEINRIPLDISGSPENRLSRSPHGSHFEGIQMESPGGKVDNDIPLHKEETEDYSLRSYFKHLPVYASLEDKIYSLSQKTNISLLYRRLLVSTIVLLYFAYFIAVLILPNIVEDYWCHGDGFLIIVNVLALLLVIYFKLLKPLVGQKIYRTWKSLKEKSEFKSRYVKLALNIGCVIALIIFLVIDSASDRSRLISVFGIFVLILFGFLFSKAPRKIIWRQVLWGLGLQFVMGLIILRWSVGQAVFSCLGDKVHAFLLFTDKGSGFVYGKIVSELHVFAFKILSVILFFSFFIQILYYYGIMQWIVIKLGWLLQVTVGTTACESVNAAANIFLGQSEAPLLIKPFLPKMTKSELHAVMTGGFATIAGSVLAAYISFGVDPAHLLSASVMSAPAALGFAKLFYPEVEISQTRAKDIKITKGKESNVLHAACEGVVSAIPLVANITANLLAFIAFIAFVDAILNWACLLISVEDGVCSLSNIFGYVFMPLAWIMGVPWKDCYIVGQLIGTKTIINEFVGYLKLTEYMKNKAIAKRSEIIATYALCGFSNISGIGIQLGALGAMAPERRGDLAQIAFRAMIAGSVACFLTACVAGSLISVDDLENGGDVIANTTSGI